MSYRLLIAVFLLKPAFAGEAHLAVTAPDTNVDGSPLTNLESVCFHHGLRSGSYRSERCVPADAGQRVTLTWEGLPDFGTQYFAATARNALGIQTPFGEEVSKLMGPAPPVPQIEGRRFDGDGDYAMDEQPLPPLRDFTIAFWLQAESGKPGAILGAVDDGNRGALVIEMGGGDRGRLARSTIGVSVRSGRRDRIEAALVLPEALDGAWHLHVLTRDNGQLSYFIDTAEVPLSFSANSLSNNALSLEHALALGGVNNRGTVDSFGRLALARVAVFDTAISYESWGQLLAGLPVGESADAAHAIRNWPLERGLTD